MTSAPPALDLAVTVRLSPTGGPALLWLHGYTMDSSLWQPIWELMPQFTHVSVDLPGHGSSPAIPAGLTLRRLAATIADIATDHAATRVAALCFGTSVALQWAIDRPDSITALTLAAPTIAGSVDEPTAQQRYRELAMLRRFVGPGEQMASLWMTSPPDIFLGLRDRPGPAAAVRQVLTRHRWNELLDGSMGRLTTAVQSRADLARITARTQVLVGDGDLASMRANADILRDNVSGSVVTTLPGLGHLPPLEHPAGVAPLIAAHLDG